MTTDKTDFQAEILAQVDCISSLEHERLVSYAKSYVYLTLRTQEIMSEISHNDQFVIDEYFNHPIPSCNSNSELIEMFDYLTQVYKKFSSLLKTDIQATGKLAFDDPGAYAKLISCRRHSTQKGTQLGQYNENKLSDFLYGDKKAFNIDHSYWFTVCETGQLQEPKSRVSST